MSVLIKVTVTAIMALRASALRAKLASSSPTSIQE